MAQIHVRPAAPADLPRLTEIYNYFVVLLDWLKFVTGSEYWLRISPKLA